MHRWRLRGWLNTTKPPTHAWTQTGECYFKAHAGRRAAICRRSDRALDHDLDHQEPQPAAMKCCLGSLNQETCSRSCSFFYGSHRHVTSIDHIHRSDQGYVYILLYIVGCDSGTLCLCHSLWSRYLLRVIAYDSGTFFVSHTCSLWQQYLLFVPWPMTTGVPCFGAVAYYSGSTLFVS